MGLPAASEQLPLLPPLEQQLILRQQLLQQQQLAMQQYQTAMHWETSFSRSSKRRCSSSSS
jgi:hypothetical protein